MKKVMTILGALLVSSTCFAQQLKTYNGNYDLQSYKVDILGLNEGWFDGTANYTYYEDKEYRRILSGEFTYNGKLNENMSKAGNVDVDASLYVKGNYKNDKKNGKWYIKQSMKTNQGTASCVFNGSFKNGLPDGAWVISATANNNSQTITANFNNNILNGEFKITASSNKGQTTTGTLDEDGYLTGSAQIIKNNIEIKAEYQRGLCTFFMKRNLQDGRIYEKYKIDPLELKIFNLLMDEKDTSITDTIPYKIIHDSHANYIGDDFIEAFKMGSLMDMFPGDASLDENNRFTWKGFDLRSLKKSESKKDLRIRLEKEEEERLARIKAEEEERLARIKAEEERLQKLEVERLARIKAEEERLQKLEVERLARIKAEEEERLARIKAEEVRNLNNKAMESLLKKDYSGAITFCEKGIALDDDNLYLKGNLAHGYLLFGDFEKAREIYLKYLGSYIDNQTSWLKMIEMDFTEFNSKGIKSEDMDRILYEVRMNKEDRQNYELLSEDERKKQFKKNKRKAGFNKFLKDAINN